MAAPQFLNDPKDLLDQLLKNGTLYKADILRLQQEFERLENLTTEEFLIFSHKLNRLTTIHMAGLGQDKKFKQELEQLSLTDWSHTKNMDIAPELQESLAEKLYNVDTSKDRGAMLLFGDRSRHIAHHIVARLIKDQMPFIAEFVDTDFKNLVFKHADETGIKSLAAFDVATNAKANKKIVAIPNTSPAPSVNAPASAKNLYAEECRPMRLRSANGDMFFTLTTFPTEQDAALDDIPYKDYLKLYFEMCDQPWDEISKAQEYLIQMFNKASNVRFTNNDGTDISMSLIDHDGSHFTFCNSVIAKNVPGSEIFSAPRRDSVNGVIVAKGKFSPKDSSSSVIENLTLHFEQGKLVKYKAEKGAEHFQEFLDKDPGNYWVGELGIGTNPHLKKHVMNTLLVEKIGGSFHLALGNAYTMSAYEGTPVKVDNGNKSLSHWDITTMLIGKEGTIELDGKLIMKDGKFLDPKLEVLNKGWVAIEQSKRPDYWKNYQGPNLF